MKTVSRQAPLPSGLILISRAASCLMNSIYVTWLPRTSFCLSCSDAGHVDVFVARHDDAIAFAGDAPLQGSHSVKSGVSLGHATEEHLADLLSSGWQPELLLVSWTRR